jgi:predicted dehydrogenase
MLARMENPGAKLDPEPASFADGLAGMRVLDAVRRSSEEQRWVEID